MKLLHEVIPISQAVIDAQKYIAGIKNKTIPIIKTPWNQLNSLYVGGYEIGNIITIAGHSGTGKTALMCQMAVEFPRLNPDTKLRILCLSLETRASALALRMQSYLQQVTKSELVMSTVDMDNTISTKLSNLPIDIWDIGLNTGNLKPLLVEYIKAHPNEVVIFMIDHTRLVNPTNFEDELATMKRIINVLIEMKREYPNALYITFSQLNDSVKSDLRINPTNYSGHYPRYTDMYYGRELWQASDSVIVMNNPSANFLTVYGPEYYPSFQPATDIDPELIYMYMHVLKSRDGIVETFPLVEQLRHNRVRELTDIEYLKFIEAQKKNRKGYGFG